MDHREGIFAFVQVFGETFLLGVVCRREILVVVADLEEAADEAAHEVEIVLGHFGPDGAFGEH